MKIKLANLLWVQYEDLTLYEFLVFYNQRYALRKMIAEMYVFEHRKNAGL